MSIHNSTNPMDLPKKCAGKESLQRVNYLLQLANQLSMENPSSYIASLQYTNLAVSISKKAVQRLDTDIKRELCKRCRSILIAGVTCKIRIKKKKIIKRCLKCTQAKVFNTKMKDFRPWNQKDESVIQLLDYTPKESTPTSSNKPFMSDKKHN
ncbi:uncharacterized protein Rpp21 [Euwallacea similis]|uniref:uncharacterized protein Rpp21 n=1 Tax=Euwallacea similis TaxID=1736056 RepID=UPI00344C4836